MTMQRMVEYLESRGFKVTKRYISEETAYEFVIKKDGVFFVDHFEYPERASDNEKSLLQQYFLDKIISGWNTQCRIANDRQFDDISLYTPPTIKKVIFNPPATIVLWEDGTKTVVKAQNDDEFDSEKGLAMAISKKALGNKGNYCNEIKKWTEPYEEEVSEIKRFLEWLTKPVGPTPIELAYDALQSISYPKTTKPVMKQQIDKAIKYLKEALED